MMIVGKLQADEGDLNVSWQVTTAQPSEPGKEEVEEGSAIGGMWGMLWRSVVYFPFQMLMYLVSLGIWMLGAWCLGQAIACAVQQEWLCTATFILGVPVSALLWRWFGQSGLRGW